MTGTCCRHALNFGIGLSGRRAELVSTPARPGTRPIGSAAGGWWAEPGRSKGAARRMANTASGTQMAGTQEAVAKHHQRVRGRLEEVAMSIDSRDWWSVQLTSTACADYDARCRPRKREGRERTY